MVLLKSNSKLIKQDCKNPSVILQFNENSIKDKTI